jgi:integrase
MRFGEISALSVDQIDLPNRKLRIDRTLAKGEGGYRIKMSPKTESGNRTVPIAPEVALILGERLRERGRSGLIFASTDETPVTGPNAAYYVKKPAQKLGIASGFHSSRHYWASLMIDRGIPLPTIAKLLGHSSPRTTMEEYAWCIADPSDDLAVLAVLG